MVPLLEQRPQIRGPELLKKSANAAPALQEPRSVFVRSDLQAAKSASSIQFNSAIPAAPNTRSPGTCLAAPSAAERDLLAYITVCPVAAAAAPQHTMVLPGHDDDETMAPLKCTKDPYIVPNLPRKM